MLCMDIIAEIRRRHFVSGETISAIARSLKLSRGPYRRAEGLRQSWQQFKQDRRAIFSQKMRWPERQAALSIAIFERLKREERLRDAFGSISPAKGREMQAVQEKNKVAILDTIAPAVPESAFGLQNQLARQQREQAFLQEQATRLRMNDLLADKSAKHQVIYRTKDGSPAFTDKGDSIVFNRKDMEQDKLALGLELAIAKYGESLRLTGSEAFKMKMVEVAAERNLKVSFKPDELQKLLEQRRETLLSQRKPMEKEEGRIVPEPEREVLPTVEATAKREAALLRVREQLDERGKETPAMSQTDLAKAEESRRTQAILDKWQSADSLKERDPSLADSLYKEAQQQCYQLGYEQARKGQDMPDMILEYRELESYWHGGMKKWKYERVAEAENSGFGKREAILQRANSGVNSILEKWQEAMEQKEQNYALAKSLVIEAMNMAKALGQENARDGLAMPEVFADKPSLRNYWQDGAKQIEQERERDQGMEM